MIINHMKTKLLYTIATVGLITGVTSQVSAAEDGVTAQETYLGELEYQDQTITKKSAELLHRQILLQRTTQLVSWAMPMVNFYQLYPGY